MALPAAMMLPLTFQRLFKEQDTILKQVLLMVFVLSAQITLFIALII